MKLLLLTLKIFLIMIVSYLFGIVSYRDNLPPLDFFRDVKNVSSEFINKQTINFFPVEKFSFQLTAQRVRYFALDQEGNYIDDSKKETLNIQSYLVDNDVAYVSSDFSNKDTAIIIMDAWEDQKDAFLNQKSNEVFYNKIFPILKAFKQRGFSQYAFTNDPKKSSFSKLFPELEDLISKGSIEKRFHSKNQLENFDTVLKGKGITKLIYVGFHSNMCILGRPVGMFGMANKGYSTYFVPESSAAIETKTSQKAQEIERITKKIIMQNFSGVLDFEQLIKKLSN